MIVPSKTHQVLELFEGPLRGVRFPDSDGDKIQAAVEAAHAASDAVARAESELESARAALAEAQRGVLHESERALAYARVYAADRPELRAALDAVGGMPAEARRPARQKRSPRGSADPTEESKAAE